MTCDEEMIDTNFKIQLSPALNQKEIMRKLEAGEQPTAEDLANLSKVKAKIKIVSDYEDMEKVRKLLKNLAQDTAIGNSQ
jgi:hypothetical protein